MTAKPLVLALALALAAPLAQADRFRQRPDPRLHSSEPRVVPPHRPFDSGTQPQRSPNVWEQTRGAVPMIQGPSLPGPGFHSPAPPRVIVRPQPRVLVGPNGAIFIVD